MPLLTELQSAADLVRAEFSALPLIGPSEASAALVSFLNGAGEDTPATAVFGAVSRLLGARAMIWEPESVWLGLADLGVTLEDDARNKYMAVSTLRQNPAFYWDANIFEDTCLAFNGEPVIVGALQEASPAQLAWGVFEAFAICRADGNVYEFDHEPTAYTAVSLLRAGFMTAPELLIFAGEELAKLHPDNNQRDEILLHSDVIDSWNKLDSSIDFASDSLDTELAKLELKETPLDVQVAKLLAVRLYIQQRLSNLRNALTF